MDKKATPNVDTSRSVFQTGCHSPSKRNNTKRLLSSSSNSPTTPTHTDKKIISFCSLNRYYILAFEDDNNESTALPIDTIADCEQCIQYENKVINDRASPIYTKHISITNCSALKNTFIQLTSVNDFL